MKAHLLAWMLTAFVGMAAAQPLYRTAGLKRLAVCVGLPEEQVGEGEHIIRMGEIDLAVRCTQGEIDHVGKYLFPQEMKTAMRSPLPYFLERYLLTLQYPPTIKTIQQMLRDDQVSIEHGSIASVAQIRADDEFSYNLTLNRYTVTWKRDGKRLLQLSFPADFELLYGTTQIEAEQQVESDIRNSTATEAPKVNAEELTATTLPDYYLRKGSFYLAEDLNDNRYYHRDSTGAFQLVYSASHPLESAANMMTIGGKANGIDMEVTEILYGFQEKRFVVNAGQWIAYCQQSGCTLYYGTEKMDSAQIEATVVAVNTYGGYVHLLSVNIPLSVFDGSGDTIHATLYPFIPTHNVRNLFAKNKKNKQKRERIYMK